MPEKIPEPMNTRSFGVVMALSQLGEQPALAGLGTIGEEIRKLIAESRDIVAGVNAKGSGEVAPECTVKFCYECGVDVRHHVNGSRDE